MAETCREHPEAPRDGCAACFEEGLEQGFADLIAEMPGCEIRRVTVVTPGHLAYGDVFWGETYLFSAAYGQGFGPGVPAAAAGIIEAVISVYRRALDAAVERYGEFSGETGTVRRDWERARQWRAVTNFRTVR